MKKTLIATLPVAAFVAGLSVVPSVFADSNDSITTWDTLRTCLTTPSSTCTLADDFEADLTSSGVVLADNVTLNLGTHTLTINGTRNAIWVDQGHKATITGTGGKIQSNGFGVAVEGNTADKPTKLTIGAGVEINASKPLGIFNNDQNVSNVQIDGTLTSTDSVALSINGDIQSGPNITITGTLNGTTAGIYQAGGSIITINNGKVSGHSGIVTKAGTLNLNNANVTGNGEYQSGTALLGKFGPTGAGIQIESYDPPYEGNITLNITDSTITSSQGDAIQEYGDSTTQVLQAINLNGDVTLTPAAGKKALAIEESVGEQANNFKVTIDGAKVDNAVLTSAEGTFTTIETPAPTPENPTEEIKNPNTADPIALYATVAVLAVLGLGATAVVAKKSNR